MNEHERPEDPAFDRLTAADPARNAPGPVEGVLRAKVDALIAASGERPATASRRPDGDDAPGGRAAAAGRDEDGPDGSGRGSSGPGSSGHGGSDRGRPEGGRTVDELAVRRHRRRTPWLVAAAVAGVVVVGGGGYLAGESGLGAGPAADTAAAPASESSVEDGTATGDEPPSVLGMPERATSQEVEPLDAGGELPTATGIVFHAGAGLSRAPGSGEVRVAGTAQGLGTYPVISEVAAVERLGDPRFAGSVLGQRPERTAGSSGGVPAPGGAIAWPVEDVTIVSATRTEVRYALPDGTVLVVPAYRLADATGSGWTVMAVDEELLDLTP
ncbi:hypothetical protein [Promicromonospora sp. NPDC050880]|uniref:hypothetical protein n=1 Tax=Promicromonospora sp. NPDC050880 TaxID=3364406 RepID=UPI0037B0BE4E